MGYYMGDSKISQYNNWSASPSILPMLVSLKVTFLERNTVNVGSHEDPSNIELGLLAGASPSPTTQEDDPEYPTPLRSPADASDHRQPVHEVIGDALEVFSRHLRAHR